MDSNEIVWLPTVYTMTFISMNLLAVRFRQQFGLLPSPLSTHRLLPPDSAARLRPGLCRSSDGARGLGRCSGALLSLTAFVSLYPALGEGRRMSSLAMNQELELAIIGKRRVATLLAKRHNRRSFAVGASADDRVW